jgi:transglycosylase-like protein with SLT domain
MGFGKGVLSVNVASAVIIALAGVTVLGTSEPAPQLPGEVPPTVTGAAPAASHSTPPDVVGPAAAEGVTLTMRPIPYPPALEPPPADPLDLQRSGILIAAYQSAADAAPTACRLPVSLLAAIGQIESGSAGGREILPDHRVDPAIYGPVLDGGPFAAIADTDGGLFDGDVVWDRAVGPMQFIPGTWRSAGVDGDGDGLADPQNVYDAAFSAAGYLCRGNRDLSQPRDLRAAIWSYNHSADYVVAVLEWMAYFGERGLVSVGEVGFLVSSGGRASELASPGVSAAGSPTTTGPTTGGPTTGGPTTSGPSSTTSTLPSPVTTTAPGATTTTGPGGPTDPSDPTSSPTGTVPTDTWTTTPDPTTTTPEPTTTTTPEPTTTTPTTTTTTTTTTVPEPTAPASCPNPTETSTGTTTTDPSTPDPTSTGCSSTAPATVTTTDGPTSTTSAPAPQQTSTP